MKYQQQLTSILDQTQSSQRRKIFVLLSAKLIESARYTHVACKNIFFKKIQEIILCQDEHRSVVFEGYYKQELNCSTFSSEIIDFCSKITENGHLDLSILDIPWTVKQAALKYARCY